jgi:Flp pilus assembly protein TadD
MRRLPVRGSANAETTTFQKRLYTSAINLFQKAVKKQPDNGLYNYHLGLAYAKNGQAARWLSNNSTA